MMRTFWLVLLLVSACKSGRAVPEGSPCGKDNDCGEAQFCVRADDGNRRAGTCASAGCVKDADCTNDRFCELSACAVRRVGGCDRDRMCPVGMFCVSGACAQSR